MPGKIAAWTYVMSGTSLIHFELRAGKKGTGRLIGGVWENKWNDRLLDQRVADIEASAIAIGYTTLVHTQNDRGEDRPCAIPTSGT